VRIWEISFELKSPAIVTRRRTERGFKEALDYIPASSLRGAILSSLYYHGRIGEDRLEQEAENPRILCTAGFPLVDGQKFWPMHPFIYECKICKEVIVADFLPKLEEGQEPILPSICKQWHQSLDFLHPRCRSFKQVGKEDKKKLKVHFTSSICVGISKDRGASEGELLYEYDAIDAGQKFWFRLCYEDSLEKGFEFWVGRGISRGFGWAKIKNVIREIKVKEEAEKIREVLQGRERTVMYALSPLLSGRGQRCVPSPDRVELSEVAKIMGIEGGGVIEVDKVYGRTIMYDAGWDMRRGRRRPILPAAAHGSLAVCRISRDADPRLLTALSVLGTVEDLEDVKLTCVNQLVPLRYVMEEW